MAGAEDLGHFLRLIEALRPFLPDVVIVGGWAHRLYRLRQDATAPPYSPLFTNDTDIAIPSNMLHPENLRDQLVAHGFTEEFLGEEQPPVTHYRLGKEGPAFYAEFLTPIIGGGGRPGKTSQETVEIAGVVAQKLRHLEILMIQPWEIRLESLRADVRVPNAVSYIAQKLLIHTKRTASQRAKDILYIHDTIELFGASLDRLRNLWLETIRVQLHKKTAANTERLAAEVCRQDANAVHDAARVAGEAGRELTAETIGVVCDEGLSRIFDRGAAE